MKISRNVYHYSDPDRPETFSIDVTEDGDALVTVSGAHHAAIKRMPRNQLTQMLYRLRDERSRTVTAELAIDNEAKKKEEGKKR